MVAEACGSAHHWARWLTAFGHPSSLLPCPVRSRLRPAQQDHATVFAAALFRSRKGRADLRPVRVKSSRTTSPARAAAFAAVDGRPAPHASKTCGWFARKFGIAIPKVPAWHQTLGRVLADPRPPFPELIRHPTMGNLARKYACWRRVSPRWRQLSLAAQQSPPASTLLSCQGWAAHQPPRWWRLLRRCDAPMDARHFASWFGLTPREYSSGSAGTWAASPEGRPLPAHAAHPRRAQHAQGGAGGPTGGQAGAGRALVGAGRAKVAVTTTKYMCAGQQAGARIVMQRSGSQTV